MSGPFQSAALELHRHGLAVIPTGGEGGKVPLVKGWQHWRGQSSATVEALASKHPGANVGVICGLSRLTIVDADDENALAEAESRFGWSPLVTRSPRGGGHLYFRSSGERNANLRKHGLNGDIRGIGGQVLVPPSMREGVGAYRIERGDWGELANLPALRPDAIPARDSAIEQPTRAVEGWRNNALFVALKHGAQIMGSLEEMIAEAHAINAGFIPPLPTKEAERVAVSVWRMKMEGRIIVRGQQRILMSPTELEKLGPDAFYFAAWLKRWHGAKGGKPFAICAKAMEKAQVLKGWGRRRYGIAVALLCSAGFLQRTHKGGSKRGDPHLYRMGAPSGPNITNTPACAAPRGKGEQ